MKRKSAARRKGPDTNKIGCALSFHIAMKRIYWFQRSSCTVGAPRLSGSGGRFPRSLTVAARQQSIVFAGARKSRCALVRHQTAGIKPAARGSGRRITLGDLVAFV
jgi:hypothetical protein